jgi:23S rRNA (cytidine1920-2'-O)/16S rRNA (cytidine1409-2'-O)-methyltransferase
MRADQLLVERGLAATAQAQRLIAASVRVGALEVRQEQATTCPSRREIELLDAAEARYVSRGGLKLEGGCVSRAGRRRQAVPRRGPVHRRLHRLPAAAARAAKVVGVDVGHGQLAQLHEEARGAASIRALSADDLREEADEAGDESGDKARSSESAESAQPSDPRDRGRPVVHLADAGAAGAGAVAEADDGRLLMLVKPQFELQPGQVGKGGIVRDESLYAQVEKRLHDACEALELRVLRWLTARLPVVTATANFSFTHARSQGERRFLQVRLPLESSNFSRPRRRKAADKLRAARQQLYARKPQFCSVTFGAGGSTHQGGTFGAVSEILAEGVDAASRISPASAPRAPRCASSSRSSRP